MKISKKIISMVLVLLMAFSCFSLVSFAEEAEDVEHLTEVPEGYIGVYTKDDLDNIKLDMAGKYILMNDIVFEDSDYEKGGSFYNSGKGWEPIGTSSTNFKGVFNGNGYKIKNLYINNPSKTYVGLFGYAINATITKVSLENVNITGGEYVGGIVGNSSGSTTVSYCNVQGTITGTGYVGGIAGRCYASSSGIQKNVVAFCSNTGLVSAKDSYAGGIIGYLYGYSGSAQVENCYNLGNVSANAYAGGVVGYFYSGYVSCNSNAYYCYSLGTVVAKSNFGGCFGVSPSSYSFCYYLDEGVVNPTCKVGIPKSEDQLKKATTFEQWDFKTVWTMSGRKDYPYPEIVGSYPILSEDSMHKHEYTSETTTPATHITTGVMTFTCACGDTYTETVDKISTHNYGVVITEPTCTEKGYTTYTCECNDSYVDDYVDATGHDFKLEETAPTCTEQGYTTYTCECGESYIRNYVNANGHNYTSEITIPATHLNSGVELFTCECGDTYTKEIDKIPIHDFKTNITAPTCTEQGYTTYICECGETYIRDYVNAIGHNFKSVVTAPTCTEQGYTTYICECKDNYVDNYVDAIGHNANGDDICNNCGATVEIENPSENCNCSCHKSGITKFFFDLIVFFSKLFGLNKFCECGLSHY